MRESAHQLVEPPGGCLLCDPDALAGGPFMAALDLPLILADDMSSVPTSWLSRWARVEALHDFGGAAVVNVPLESGVAQGLRLD
jgi:hypothetical protein